MSICPKNKSSKGRRDKRRANWKMSAPNLGKMQQMWSTYDASQSMQGLRQLTTRRKSFTQLTRLKTRCKRNQGFESAWLPILFFVFTKSVYAQKNILIFRTMS